MNTNNNEYLLTFELDLKNETLEIHGNRRGLEKLSIIINTILSNTTNDHVHLMTPDWGGNELSKEKQCSQNELIHHVKIFNWSNE
ncbi:MAG: Imm32 family immunity protein [Parachlamydiales bacterium]